MKRHEQDPMKLAKEILKITDCCSGEWCDDCPMEGIDCTDASEVRQWLEEEVQEDA